jgi:hypothetical protein
MKLASLLACGFALAALAVPTSARAADERIYEMRVYYANPGKLDALNARFRDHTVKLFEKHGITNVGYFTPIDNTANKLVYFVSYPSFEARKASWDAFSKDPAWQAARSASEADGKLLAKVENCFLKTTDYSPTLKIAPVGDRVIELRTYLMTPGNLPAINARFRDHTMKLFEKHGMTNLIYWNLTAEQPAAKTTLKPENTLVYLLAHKSKEAGLASFGAFRQDPDWIKARTSSEEKAGGSLTLPQPEGVQSEYLVPTDYSPLK